MRGSNLSILTAPFFATLGGNADELRSTVLTFYGDETDANAHKVYRAFLSMFGLFMPDGDKDFIDLLELLHDYEETAATLIDKQRDHFVHSVNVFLTGIAIYAGNGPFRRAFAKNDAGSVYMEPASSFLFRWGLASLFHDIGYPVEIVGNQINRYIRIVTDADGDDVKVQARLSYDHFSEIDHIVEISPPEAYAANLIADAKAHGCAVDASRPIDLMSYRIFSDLHIDYAQLRDALLHFVERMGETGFIDHGYYSALILLKWCGYMLQKKGADPKFLYGPVLDSCTAILLHNYYKNALMKEPFSLGALCPSDMPIAFLLILCDELQEWNRMARGILTKTFILAESVNLSITDRYLGVNYVTRDGLLPESFGQKKVEFFRTVINAPSLFPLGIDVDNVDVRETVNSRLPLAIHAYYIEKRLAEHPEEAVEYPRFSDLPDDLKHSNIRQAEGIERKLEIAGCHLDVTGLPGAVERFGEDLVEQLAEAEHADWMEERIASGWRFGPKNVEEKTSPYLIPYAELSEEIKDYDREPVRNIPRLVSLIGMAVYPNGENESDF